MNCNMCNHKMHFRYQEVSVDGKKNIYTCPKCGNKYVEEVINKEKKKSIKYLEKKTTHSWMCYLIDFILGLIAFLFIFFIVMGPK